MNTKLKGFICRFLILMALGMPTSPAAAKPTTEEKKEFIAQQKREKETFDRSILKITDPRAAASTEFFAQAKAERIAFLRTLTGLPQAEKTEALNAFHKSARDKQKDFEKKLQTIPLPNNVKLDEIVDKRKKFERERREKARAFYAD